MLHHGWNEKCLTDHVLSTLIKPGSGKFAVITGPEIDRFGKDVGNGSAVHDLNKMIHQTPRSGNTVRCIANEEEMF